MSQTAGTVAAITAIEAANETGSYRVKFSREKFIELTRIARPKILYRRKKNHFFAFNGFVMYSQECSDSDFPGVRIIEALELSNYAWAV